MSEEDTQQETEETSDDLIPRSEARKAFEARDKVKAALREQETRAKELEAKLAEIEESKAKEAGSWDSVLAGRDDKISKLEAALAEAHGQLESHTKTARNRQVFEGLSSALELDANQRSQASIMLDGFRARGLLDDGSEDTDTEIKKARKLLKDHGFGANAKPAPQKRGFIPPEREAFDPVAARAAENERRKAQGRPPRLI